MKQHRVLYTVGHSNHSLESFVELLLTQGVTCACDVRSAPYSRMNPQFNREILREALKLEGITYVFLGKELGARSENPKCYIDGKVQYDALERDDLFLRGLERLQKGMLSYTCALVCAEHDPLMCHRAVLVTKQVQQQSIEVQHILRDGSIESKADFEARLLTEWDVLPDLFQSKEAALEQAYRNQANRIAYVLKEVDAR